MPTQHRGTPAETRALNAYINLMRAADTITARTMPVAADHELTLGQFGVLEAIYHLGPLHPGELARKLLRSTGNVSTVVDNLEKRGLVDRARSMKDRRYITVVLTDLGRRVIRRAFPAVVKVIVASFEDLDVKDQEELRRICRTLGRRGKP